MVRFEKQSFPILKTNLQLLMFATKNADKDTEDSENATRIKMMEAFSKTVSELCETHICLTEHPYFVVSTGSLVYEGGQTDDNSG